MKRWTVMAAALCVTLASSVAMAQTSSGQSKPGTGTGQTSGTKPDPKTSGQASDTKAQAGKADAAFAREAAMAGLAEVELGRVASQNATNADVKQFGQRMVDDHTKANDELKGLASQKGLELPTSLGPKHAAARDKLAKLSGDAFDRAYMEQMVQDHNQAVTLFDREAKTGRDPELKAWAEKHLPHLREHQKMARDIHAKIRGGKSGAKTEKGDAGTR